jgi:lipoprotein-releasing system permease protein
MVELIILYFLCRMVGDRARRLRREPRPYQWLLVGLWFGGEFLGLVLSIIFAGLHGISLGGAAMLVPYAAALVGAIIGLVIAFLAPRYVALPTWLPLVILSVLLAIVLDQVLALVLFPPGWTGPSILAHLLGWVPLTPIVYGALRLADWLFERLMENNYKTLLIGRYLRSRAIAWISLVAVTLCTTMVLVVISVMGGWLNMFEHSFQGLTGDIVVESQNLSGFGYYDEMIDRMQRQPSIAAAVPAIHTFGILNIGNIASQGVQVMGLPLDQIGKVNRFPDSLYLQYQQYTDEAKTTKDPAIKAKLMQLADAAKAHASFKLPLPPTAYQHDPALQNVKTDPATFPGMIPGSAVIGIHRMSTGETIGRDPFLYLTPLKLTTIAIHPGEMGVNDRDKNETIYWMVDDSHTGLWQYDNNFVYVPFDELQRDLQMTAQDSVDLKTNQPHIEPARVSEIHIRVKPDYDLNQAKQEVVKVVESVTAEHRLAGDTQFRMPEVQTWREKQHIWIDAISNEKLLTVLLFSIISLVAVFLVFCIFYMIVMEKTKDIGIIKSVGATSSGVAGIFLGYGLVIGLVGSLMGLLCSYLIVHYINELHAELGRLFHVQIWNPEVYVFDKIPNTMSWRDIAVIVPIAIISSVLGALLPALRAAQMHPVESLRWE